MAGFVDMLSLPCFSIFFSSFLNVNVSNRPDSRSALVLVDLSTSGLFPQAELSQNCSKA